MPLRIQLTITIAFMYAGGMSANSCGTAVGAPPSLLERPQLAAELVEVLPIEIAKSETLPKPPDGDLELVVEPLQQSTLPFQAITVRVSLVNRTENIIGPFFDVDRFAVFRGDSRNRDSLKFICVCSFDRRPVRCIKLGPKQRLSIDVAFAHSVATRHLDKFVETAYEPIFYEEPTVGLEGTYHGKWTGWNRDDLKRRFQVTLAELKDHDRATFLLLKSDPTLARCLYDKTYPPEPRHISGLRNILEAKPDSSYADYARLALARAYVGGSGERLPTLSRRLILPPVDEHRPKLPSYFLRLQRRVSPFLNEAEWQQARRSLVADHNLPLRERFVQGIQLQSLTTAGLNERREAVRLLKDIRSRDFALASYALKLEHQIAEIDDPDRLPEITAEFHKRFPCSVEWLSLLQEVGEYSDKDLQAWVNYRVITSNTR